MIAVFFKNPSKFKLHWMEPYKVKIIHDNGSFKLVDFEGVSFPTRISGHRLKKIPYVIEDSYLCKMRRNLLF